LTYKPVSDLFSEKDAQTMAVAQQSPFHQPHFEAPEPAGKKPQKIWVNYNISLPFNVGPFGDDFPYEP
jgi:hypothetical protein